MRKQCVPGTPIFRAPGNEASMHKVYFHIMNIGVPASVGVHPLNTQLCLLRGYEDFSWLVVHSGIQNKTTTTF